MQRQPEQTCSASVRPLWAKCGNRQAEGPLASSHRAQSRRRRDLVAIFLDALGGRAVVSELQLVQVRKAAELTMAAEAVRSPPAKGPRPRMSRRLPAVVGL